MKRRAIVLVLSILIAAAHRLPAPIVEETTPTPAAPAAKSRPKPKKEERAKKPTSSKPSINSFLGRWTGTVTTSGQLGDWPISGNASRTVIISSDGTVTYFGQSGGQTGPQSQSKVVLSRDGRSAGWTNQQTQQGMTSRGTYSLQLARSNSATYQEDGVFSSPEASGSLKASGTLTKQ